MNAPLLLAALAGTLVVAVVVMAAVLGWGGSIGVLQRVSLCSLAAGLVGAGFDRVLQRPVGWFDTLFLAGLALYLAANYGRAIWLRADALDGDADGRVNLPGGPPSRPKALR